MSAAAKALDALEDLPSWEVVLDIAAGRIDALRNGLDSDVHDSDAAARLDCMRALFAGTISRISSPLAAVARAAMARPWWRRTSGDEYCFQCVNCHQEDHSERCRFAKIDAALDALEAAAEGGAS